MSPKCQHWLDKLASLKKDRSRGVAPHKPLLHLVVIDMFEAGKLSSGGFRRDGELAFRFNSYWSLGALGRGSRPDVMLPFFHTRSDGFWTPFEEDGRVAEARNLARIARIDPDYLRCLNEPSFRAAARRVLITSHFAGPAQAALANLIGIAVTDTSGSLTFLEQPEMRQKREARFAFDVLPAYDFTCALSRYRMVADDGTTVLDAAHIRSFSDGGPNIVTNGLALSKTAHWLFDRGFWSLDQDYHILVKSRDFGEHGDAALLLKPRDGTEILVPVNKPDRPSAEFLAWHRKRHKF